MSLRTQQDWVVRPQLLRVPGVADVVSYGGLLREIHVEPDPVRMAALEVGLSDIFEALRKASDNASGGYVERGSEMFVIRSLGIFKDLRDIEQVRVGSKGGVPVTVRDVGGGAVGPPRRQGIVTRNADEDAVEGIVLMRRGENPSVVLKALRERIADINERVLPQGIRIRSFYDRTELVDTTLHTVFHNLAEGAFLVVLVLFLFMLSVKASLIVAAVIPLSLFSSFLYLYVRGMSANLLSMGAVDFGIIVDGAVILVEHLFHRVHGEDLRDDLHPGNEAERLSDRILKAAREVARPTLFSLLIIIAAYLPIFSLQRVEGRIFRPMANTVVSALLGALLVSFTLVPVLAHMSLRRSKPVPDSPLLSWARRAYDPAIRFSMLRPEIVVTLKPMPEWRSSVHGLDDLIAEMERNIREIPGTEYNFSQPIRDNVNENISGQFGQIAVKIYGDDLDVLQDAALKAEDAIAKVSGVADLGIVKSGEMPQIAVNLDRPALARYDLDLADVQDYVETAMGGHVASELWEGEKRFDVTVRLPPSTREDIGSIRTLMLPLKNGALVPLAAVAPVRMGSGRA